MAPKNQKVVVGMSGGVDSSVSAFLLKKDGYDVCGVFMQNWDNFVNNDHQGQQQDTITCKHVQDYNDVKAVAATLDIPTAKVNFVEKYWNEVFLYFLDQYALGRTPNPDILCNEKIKFKSFFNYANKAHHADLIAMGHYAQIRFNKNHQEYELIRAVDSDKDQTYFLSRLNQNIMSQIIFPIGHLLKTEVRSIAQQSNLIVANKKDSTGICFIGERHFRQFLQQYLPPAPGLIINITNHKTEGHHNGVMFYTIGQHHDLNLGGKPEASYVVGKDVTNKILYISPKSQKDKWLFSNQTLVRNFHFINSYLPAEFSATVKFRYRQKDIPVKVVKINNHDVLLSYKAAYGVTPGQEAVLYQNEVCLGGGEISQVFVDNQPLDYLK